MIRIRRLIAVLFFVLLPQPMLFSQKKKLEDRTVEVAEKVVKAVTFFYFWPSDFSQRTGSVAGTAFFVGDKGYFITAAHVLRDVPAGGRLSLQLLGKDGNSASLFYEIVERDDAHDLALCRVQDFERLYQDGSLKLGTARLDFGFLKIADDVPKVGSFLLVAGYPLGSWNPAVQFGVLAAKETLNPNVQGVPAGRGPLLQIDVTANKGNSGSPVVNLSSGEVIGVIIQGIPDQIHVLHPGIALAAPAEWIKGLLLRHNVSASEKQGKRK